MSTGVVHRLTGYDKKTDLLAIECNIPIKNLALVKEIAQVGPDDPDAIGSYPLDRHQAECIARLLGTKIDVDKYDFFLEPFADSDQRSPPRIHGGPRKDSSMPSGRA